MRLRLDGETKNKTDNNVALSCGTIVVSVG